MKILKPYQKTNLPDVKPGDTIKVHQKIKEIIKKGKKGAGEERERIQVFEGVVIARKHGKGVNATITVRKLISGVGVEKTFPIHSPLIDKIEVVSRAKVRRSKLYYLRNLVGKKARLKKKNLSFEELNPIQEEPKKEVKEEVVEEVKEEVKEEKPVEESKPEEKPVEEKKEEPEEKPKEEVKQEPKEEKKEDK